MPIKFTFSSPLMKSWLLIHQSHRLLEKNENKIYAQFGITPRKHAVLMAIKNLPAPLKVTDVARWLDRNPNGISMLADRMERDGLITRKRIKTTAGLYAWKLQQRGSRFTNAPPRLSASCMMKFSGITSLRKNCKHFANS